MNGKDCELVGWRVACKWRGSEEVGGFVLASCFELIGGVGEKLVELVVRGWRRFEEIVDSAGIGGE